MLNILNTQGENMTASERSNRAVFNAIVKLSRQFLRFGIRDIASVSTYSQPTVIRAIKALEEAGYIHVDRSEHAKDPTAPHAYTIMREMGDDKKGAPRC